MQAFLEETNEKLGKCTLRDACLLASLQGINHYKISNYGTATAFAADLGLENLRLFSMNWRLMRKISMTAYPN
jgi:ferritin-like metal-binding protein YciE